MAKVEAVGIRPGNLIEWDKRVWRVLKSYHVHVGGRGGAFMQVEMKDIETGTKTNQRFRTEDKVERAFVDPRDMQYLYQDGDSYVFMDKENYEQLSLPADSSKDIGLPAAEHRRADQLLQQPPHRRRAAALRRPHRRDTEPGIKNSTATNSFKPAKMETGITVQVPPFINKGEKIKIDTAEGKYMERA